MPGGPFTLPREVEIIAHRGFSARAPENTLAALDMGVDAGADAVEFDLHTTRDGVPVLLHDATLQRTTNAHGAITSFALEDLEGIDAGSWFGDAFAGEPLPTLEAALAGPCSRVGRVYAEVKDVHRRADLDGIVEAVRSAGLMPRTVFISMDWEALDDIRGAEPRAAIGYIVEDHSRAEEAFARATGDPRALLDFDARILLAEPALAARALEAGIPLAVWTVNTPSQAQAVYELGVRRITTNEVEALIAWREGLPRQSPPDPDATRSAASR